MYIQLFLCKMHLLGAFCCKMECYLFCNICIIVMQMLKFRNTHMKRLKVSLVRRWMFSSWEVKEGAGSCRERGKGACWWLPNMDGGSAGQTILLRMRISSLLGLERWGRLHWIESGPPISKSPSHLSLPNSCWSHPKTDINMQNNAVSCGFYCTLQRGWV